jgi:predicted nucleotidyltransferase
MPKKSDIINYLISNEELLKSKFHLTRIGVFGSFARGEENKDSDIDIILEFEDGTEKIFELKQELIELLKNTFNLDIDICREKYIKPHFKEEILNETVYAYKG